MYVDKRALTEVVLNKNTGVYTHPNTLSRADTEWGVDGWMFTLCFAVLSVHFEHPSPCNATSSLIRFPVQIYLQ